MSFRTMSDANKYDRVAGTYISYNFYTMYKNLIKRPGTGGGVWLKTINRSYNILHDSKL